MIARYLNKRASMLKLPLLVIYAIIAFNISAFTVMLQMDLLIYHSEIAKAICLLMTVGAWMLTYIHRDKFIKLF